MISRTTPLLLSYLALIAVLFILPFYSAEGYSIVSNTSSQLGAQHTPNAWIMNTLFVLLGSTSVLAGWKRYSGFWLHRIVLLAFGSSLMLTAFFSHAPIDPTVEYSVREDDLHSLFASITGFAFTVLAIATGFIHRNRTRRILAIAIGIAATLLSLLMFQFEALMGIWQRLIFLSCFAWMLFEFGPWDSINNDGAE